MPTKINIKRQNKIIIKATTITKINDRDNIYIINPRKDDDHIIQSCVLDIFYLNVKARSHFAMQ
jgi:hypothetical protein